MKKFFSKFFAIIAIIIIIIALIILTFFTGGAAAAAAGAGTATASATTAGVATTAAATAASGGYLASIASFFGLASVEALGWSLLAIGIGSLVLAYTIDRKSAGEVVDNATSFVGDVIGGTAKAAGRGVSSFISSLGTPFWIFAGILGISLLSK